MFDYLKNNAPALKLLLLILLGFVSASILELRQSDFLLIASISIILIIVMLLLRYLNTAIVVLCLAIGFTLFIRTEEMFLIVPQKITQDMNAVFYGNITKIMADKEQYTRITAVGTTDAKFLNKINDSKILITIFNKSKRLNFHNGQYIFAKVKIKFPQKKQFDSKFDEIQFLKSMGVNFSVSANSKDIAIINQPSKFNSIINSTIENLSKRIDLLYSDNSSPIIKAVVLGDKSNISPEIRQLFSASGTAHVLAVSGLHTGVIASIIFIFLSFIKNRKLKLLIFTIAITFYVIISGIQDSAIRAAVLSICILALNTFQKRYNLLNVLSFAVLIIIIATPTVIFSPGFQMSAISVFGIVIFYNPIRIFFKSFIKIENYILDFLINSVSVSLAASITISPMVAYYFGIYSIVSPLANLFVIPLFTFTLIFSVIAIAFSYIYFPISIYYVKTTEFLVYLTEKINFFSVNLPFAYIQNENVIFISVAISILITYIIYSSNIKHTLFRFAISVCIISLMYENFDNSKNSKTQIVARMQYVSLLMPLNNDYTFVFVADRKPSISPKRDSEFENYLKSLNQKLIIGYNGNAGINITDHLKNDLNFHKRKISLSQMNYLKRTFHLSEQLPQIIDY